MLDFPTIFQNLFCFTDETLIMSAFNPWFITGLTDAEGCFSVSIVKHKTSRLGYQLRLAYGVNLALRYKN